MSCRTQACSSCLHTIKDPTGLLMQWPVSRLHLSQLPNMAEASVHSWMLVLTSMTRLPAPTLRITLLPSSPLIHFARSSLGPTQVLGAWLCTFWGHSSSWLTSWVPHPAFGLSSQPNVTRGGLSQTYMPLSFSSSYLKHLLRDTRPLAPEPWQPHSSLARLVSSSLRPHTGPFLQVTSLYTIITVLWSMELAI